MYSLKDFGVTKHVRFLKNGAKVVLLYKKNSPVTTYIMFRAGSRNDPLGKEGLAHFTEHIVFKKTKKFKDATEAGEYVERLGASINAFTWMDMLGFTISIGLPKDFPSAVTYLKELIKESQFNKKHVDLERGVILREIGDSRANPDRFVDDITTNLILQDTDTGRFTLGTADTVNSIKVKDLRDFYKNLLNPDKMLVVICGDLKIDQVVKEFNSKFGLKNKKKVKVTSQADLPIIRNKFIDIAKYKGVEQVHIGFGFRTCSSSKDDSIVIELIGAILGSGFSASLFKELRTKRGLVYSIHMEENFFYDAGYVAIFTATPKHNLNKVLDVITSQFDRLCKSNIGVDEIKLAKDKIIKSKYRQMQSSNAWVNTQFPEELFNPNKPRDLASWINKINKVSKSDIVRVSKKYFGRNKWYLGLCGDIEEKDFKVNY